MVRHSTDEDASFCSSSASGSVNSSTGDNSSTASPKYRSSKHSEAPIAKAENKAVFRIRLMIVVFLAVCTVGAACLVYFVTRNSETKAFEAEFDDLAVKVFDSLGSSIETSLMALDGFAVSIVSFVQYANMTWPFVTLPDYGTRASKVRSLTKSVLITQIQAVPNADVSRWNEYSLKYGPAWVDENIKIQNEDPTFNGLEVDQYVPSGLWGNQSDTELHRPMWQNYPTVPILGYSPFNLDLAVTAGLNMALPSLNERKAVIGGVSNDPVTVPLYNTTNELVKYYTGDDQETEEPLSEMYYPIFEDAANRVAGGDAMGSQGEMVSVIGSWFYWRDLMTDILPTGSNGIVAVFENGCNQTFSYQINGPDVVFLGYRDAHEKKYDDFGVKAELIDLKQYTSSGNQVYTGLPLSDETCPYVVCVYPSQTFEDQYVGSDAAIAMGVAISIFVFTTMVFLFYDFIVERRQRKVMMAAVRSSAIVSSLFPSNVRARLYGADDQQDDSSHAGSSKRKQLKTFVNDKGEGRRASNAGNLVSTGRPIADLFPSASVLFSDIAGFTSWSSMREPSQVFILLESLYALFDRIALKRGVFKVETIGDCYMAVTGLPEPDPQHAVTMCKFASEAARSLVDLLAELAKTLGPDTEDLAMRFGINSGPVTAGVLRGQKSRFQLFGDTVNTASRMESTGLRNCIHVSESTAKEIIKHEKGHWLRARKDPVEAKGKGTMKTFWVDLNGFAGEQPATAESEDGIDAYEMTASMRTEHQVVGDQSRGDRLIDWNTDILAGLLRGIVARRGHTQQVVEQDEIILDPMVMSQLRGFVAAIAETYRQSNPFHNFEHASHVMMSVAKLMSRIVASDDYFEQEESDESLESFKHRRTFGIASDPLTLFSCAFAALIHDVDHPGVPNPQLAKEDPILAAKYRNRSVAEQHSIDVAWTMLMGDAYTELRSAICDSEEDRLRFRELVVGAVMATDIMDKELGQLRKTRWEEAFAIESNSSQSDLDINRKKTIVIEHLIQASDVAHTMQHWHVYRRWNECLFEEMVQAFEAGRSEKDPAEFWYKGELGFFDFYIVPLAKKLDDCGVFGVSSDEYLNYALENRREWELKGEDIVAEMVRKLKRR